MRGVISISEVLDISPGSLDFSLCLIQPGISHDTKRRRLREPAHKHGLGELPHVQGQGQMPRVPGCDSAGTAERSYPAAEVRAAAERSHPASEVRGSREEPPCVRGQGRPGEATRCPRPGAVTRRIHPEPEARAAGQKEHPEEQQGCAGTGGPRGAIPR